MIQNVVLEKLDANMEEATVGEWHVQPGDRVEIGQPLLELITDKVTFDYESPVAGMVRRLLAKPGSVMPVGYVMCQLGEASDELPDVEAQNQALLEEYKQKQAVTIATDAAAGPKRAGVDGAKRVRATPAARRLAKQHDLDLADVAPSEPGGIISEDDVRNHLDR